MTIMEKAAYLKGLTEGLGMDSDSKEGKLWSVLNDLLCDMANEINDLQESNMDMADALDEMSEDLTYLEELTCDLDKPEDFMDDEDWEDPWAKWLGEDDEVSDDGEEAEEDEDELPDGEDELIYDGIVYDVICPKCGEEISFDEETLAEGFTVCPNCGEKLEFDLDE